MRLLRLVARVVPEAQRAEWLREWEAEWRWFRGRRPTARRGAGQLASAARHAVWLRLDDWSLNMLSQDLRFALRVLTRRPTVTALAVLTLALAIGASAAIFSIVDSVLLQPLPFRDAGRLAVLRYEYTDTGRQNDYISVPDFFDWRAAESFEGLAAVDWPLSRTLTGAGDAVRLQAASATPNFLEVLGVHPAAGRFFGSQDASPDGAGVVVLSHALWRQRFGAAPDLIGRTIRLDDEPQVVVGILPAGLHLPTPADVWYPFGDPPGSAGRRTNLLNVFGRVAAGATFERAQVEMTTIARQLEQEYPETNEDHGVAVVPLWDAWFGSQTRPLALLLGAVGLLLLLAVANTANLLLVQLVSREGELSLKSVLGASRLRLLRQLALESLLFVGASGLLGLVLAYAGIDALRTLLPPQLPRVDTVDIDLRTFAFAGVVVVAVALLLAALFARRASPVRLNMAGGRHPADGPTRRRVRGALVSVQVAVATVLLIGAALVGRSLFALHQVDPGFRTDGTLAFRVSLPDEAYPESADTIAFFDRVLPELRRLPGVRAAEITSAVPLGGALRSTGIHAEAGTDDEVIARFVAVSEGYFDAMDIPRRSGRSFLPSDLDSAPQVAVIDDALAAALWPGEPAVGKRLSRSGPEGPWMTVVGVVGSVRHLSVSEPAAPTLYSAYAQRGWDTMDVVIATDGPAPGAAELVRARMAALAPNLPLDGLRPVEDLVADSTAPMRLQSVLFGVFGAVAVTVAALGIYAIAAYGVQRRESEIGIRLALGATHARVARLVLREGGWNVAIGLAAGLAIAAAARDLIAGLLFGIAPGDPWSFAAVPVLLGTVALAAMYSPARRASRVNPARTLLTP